MIVLERNVTDIQKSLSLACEDADRKPETVKMIAVTKSVTSAKARPLVDLGITDFAENRVEQLLEKQEDLADCDITWHLIGTLQRRKVKLIINQVDYFHALDNERLAAEIQKRAEKKVRCFVQVNVSEEESKQGVSLTETVKFIELLEKFDKIEIVGLMTMAPYDASEAFINQCFTELARKRDEIVSLKLEHAPCSELSMGMTQDYQLAIKAGATMVRIGTAFFKD